MKLGKAIDALEALRKINRQDTSTTTARRVFELKKTFETAAEFMQQEEEKILAHYKYEDNGNGRITFADVETANKYRAERKALNDSEFEIDYKPIRIHAIEGIRISGEDVGALDGIIEFVGMEGDGIGTD